MACKQGQGRLGPFFRDLEELTLLVSSGKAGKGLATAYNHPSPPPPFIPIPFQAQNVKGTAKGLPGTIKKL
eukprot:1159483-Pelagomonas_calceolata.AAC.2